MLSRLHRAQPPAVPRNCDETRPIGSAEAGSCADYRGHGETSTVETSTPGASSIRKSNPPQGNGAADGTSAQRATAPVSDGVGSGSGRSRLARAPRLALYRHCYHGYRAQNVDSLQAECARRAANPGFLGGIAGPTRVRASLPQRRRGLGYPAGRGGWEPISPPD